MRKSILLKMLAQILIPILLVFIIAAAFILNIVRGSMTELITEDLTAQSQAGAYQVGEFFTRYVEVARQMATNTELVRVLEANTETPLLETEGADALLQTIKNVADTDRNTILYSWIVDIAPSVYIQSNGPTSAPGDWDVKNSDWYQQAVNSDGVVVTEPYLSTAGSMVISIVTKVTNQSGQILGFVAVDVSTAYLNTMMEEYTLGEAGFFILATKSGMLMHFPDAQMEGKYSSEAPVSQNLTTALSVGQTAQLVYTMDGQTVYGYTSPVGSLGWTVTTGLPEQEYMGAYNRIARVICIVFVAGSLLLAVAVSILASGIVRPLKKLARAAKQIAAGELDVVVDVHTKDETGQVSTALQETVARLKEYIDYINEITHVLNEMSVGNLMVELRCSYEGEFKRLQVALDGIAIFLNETIGDIGQSATQVAGGAEQMASGAQALSQGATEQASSVEALSVAIALIASQVKGSAANADKARQHANTVGSEMQESNTKMQVLVKAMDEITDRSQEIGKIIKTIEDIAFQTNILALNAAVEAARAGTAGKGFAVVADEVRNLAGKSAEASKNTSALISASISSVQNGVSIAQETAKTLLAALDGAKNVVAQITQISTAAGEQSDSIAQVAQGIEQISSVVQTNSATAEESAATSEELSGQSEILKSLVMRFQIKDEHKGIAHRYAQEDR